jgi:hypothetical protein
MNFRMLRQSKWMPAVLSCAVLSLACGPRAHIPARPGALSLPGVLVPSDEGAQLARSLAPVLYLQRDESFPLERVVAVIHPTERVIAYHLLWRDDAHGAWIPFTTATDQEIVWVGYDPTGAPTRLWTYWHGKVLHTDWRDRGPVVVDVQWGKHGSLPRNVVESDLPRFGKLNAFYAFAWLGIWDIWLGTLTRPGPSCFCHGYDRYREFTRPLVIGERIDVVARVQDPRPVLTAVFGKYSRKNPWPPL